MIFLSLGILDLRRARFSNLSFPLSCIRPYRMSIVVYRLKGKTEHTILIMEGVLVV